MTLDELISELEKLRQEHGGDSEVAVTVNGRTYQKNDDDSWAAVVVSWDPDESVISIDTIVD